MRFFSIASLSVLLTLTAALPQGDSGDSNIQKDATSAYRLNCANSGIYGWETMLCESARFGYTCSFNGILTPGPKKCPYTCRCECQFECGPWVCWEYWCNAPEDLCQTW
ncbi:hypothetical protein BJ878DRAFT_481714 [Calycina marina]|uniref:Uncharacterized protein n=1 Tax=Calycina marina TaxID=1763456 RepID=A0A9P8CDM6_9HELO|nr:hypothetical protein BJ878DRAFT_481714 [Calycina marina]